MAVPADRQVQRSIGEVQVLRPLSPIREAGDAHGPDDARKATTVTCLDRLVSDALGIDDRAGATLSLCAQVQVVPEQLAEQVPPARGEPGLELVTGERPGLLANEETDEGAVDRIRATQSVG